jgi:hypothetical protein
MAGFVEHSPSSDLRQRPTGEEWWQESAFLTWHDRDSGIGGIFRIGHEPNHAGGIAALWFGVLTHEGTRFRRNTTNRLATGDLDGDGLGALGGRYQIYWDADRMRYRADDDGCRAELEVVDFHPRVDFFPSGAGTLTDEFASSHFEASGAVTGTIELDGRTYEIDGLCHRDRSWGLRRWDTLLNHRWVPGTIGPELSFGSISWHAIDGSLRRFGYVMRDGEVIHAEDVDLVVEIEADGTTTRGGRAIWRLPDGETLEIECRPFDGVVFEHHGVADVDNLCQIEVDGKSGFCDFEISTNPRAGSGPVTAALRAANVDGISRREPVAIPTGGAGR